MRRRRLSASSLAGMRIVRSKSGLPIGAAATARASPELPPGPCPRGNGGRRARGRSPARYREWLHSPACPPATGTDGDDATAKEGEEDASPTLYLKWPQLPALWRACPTDAREESLEVPPSRPRRRRLALGIRRFTVG